MVHDNGDISKGRANGALCRVVGIKGIQINLSSGKIVMGCSIHDEC